MKNEFSVSQSNSFVTQANGALHPTPRAIRAAGWGIEGGERKRALNALVEASSLHLSHGGDITAGTLTTALRLYEVTGGKRLIDDARDYKEIAAHAQKQTGVEVQGAKPIAIVSETIDRYRRVYRESTEVVPTADAKIVVGVMMIGMGMKFDKKPGNTVDPVQAAAEFSKYHIKDKGAEIAPAT